MYALVYFSASHKEHDTNIVCEATRSIRWIWISITPWSGTGNRVKIHNVYPQRRRFTTNFNSTPNSIFDSTARKLQLPYYTLPTTTGYPSALNFYDRLIEALTFEAKPKHIRQNYIMCFSSELLLYFRLFWAETVAELYAKKSSYCVVF